MVAALTLFAVLGGIGAAAGLALAWADRRLAPDRTTVVDRIDALLPQTQCAQCGYPGCRPYAEAVAQGAPIDLCPPGGSATAAALAELLGRTVTTPPASLPAPLARIDEARCIGCWLCVPACPVDAIVGAPQFMHTVVADLCTGCGLCIAPCPVDCIVLEPRTVVVDPRPLRILARSRRRDPEAPEAPCIRCAQCVPVCPEGLAPQELLWYAQDADWAAAGARGLDRCIECGRCNQACPSNIDLLAHFTRGRQARAAAAALAEDAARAREQFERRAVRLAASAQARDARRRERLSGDLTERPWQR